MTDTTTAAISKALQDLAKGHAAKSETERLRAVFGAVEAALASGVTRAAVLNTLRAQGFTMTEASFKSALQRIRKERAHMRQLTINLTNTRPATFNPVGEFTENADFMMQLLMTMANVSLSEQQYAIAKQVAIDTAAEQGSLNMLSLVTAWRAVPELVKFAETLARAAIPGYHADEYWKTANETATDDYTKRAYANLFSKKDN